MDGTVEVITSYKGFNKNLTCRGYQYEVGKTYTHIGQVKPCKSGFHACEYPLDVFGYYSPANSRFAIVEQSGDIQLDTHDTKVASSILTVKREVGISEMITLAIDYIYGLYNPNTPDTSNCINTEYYDYKIVNNTIDYTVVISTGYHCIVSNTGSRGVSECLGSHGIANVVKEYSIAYNTGDFGIASCTGNFSAAKSTNLSSIATNTGEHGVSISNGTRGLAVNTGLGGLAIHNGSKGMANNTGRLGSAVINGNQGIASSTGEHSTVSADGNSSVAVLANNYGKAKAAFGCAIVLITYGIMGQIRHVRCGIAGRDIKPDTWYALDSNGAFVIVDDDYNMP